MRLTVAYDGCWSVAYDRITAFWQQQPDVTRDGTAYRFTGDDQDAAVIYRRFFLAFLSAGG